MQHAHRIAVMTRDDRVCVGGTLCKRPTLARSIRIARVHQHYTRGQRKDTPQIARAIEELSLDVVCAKHWVRGFCAFARRLLCSLGAFILIFSSNTELVHVEREREKERARSSEALSTKVVRTLSLSPT